MGFLPALAPAAAGAASAAAPALASGIAAAAPAAAGLGAAAPAAAALAPAAAGLGAGVAGSAAGAGAAAGGMAAAAPGLIGKGVAALAPAAIPKAMAAPVGTGLASAIGGVQNLTKIGSALFKMGSQGAAAAPAPFTPEVRRGQPRDRSGSLGGGMFAGPQAAPSPFPQTSMNQGIMAMQPMGSPFQRPMSSSPMSPVSFNRDGGYIEGPGTGRSDSIPARIYQDGQPVQEARLSDGEFVMTERAVRGAGNGDRAKGAARMYRMMREFEKGGRVHGRA
jgi:hypothetical protein